MCLHPRPCRHCRAHAGPMQGWGTATSVSGPSPLKGQRERSSQSYISRTRMKLPSRVPGSEGTRRRLPAGTSSYFSPAQTASAKIDRVECGLRDKHHTVPQAASTEMRMLVWRGVPWARAISVLRNVRDLPPPHPCLGLIPAMSNYIRPQSFTFQHFPNFGCFGAGVVFPW